MVLRSGIILPFQYRDTKKLLMCGVPEENRDLTFFDLKNVVRAAFGIYNFEFRNKKIGFNIPDELLLHYLAQRHDLTNFVIEINQAHDEPHSREMLSFEASCSTAPVLRPHDSHVSLPQKSNESSTIEYGNVSTLSQSASPAPHQQREQVESPMEHTNNSDDHGGNSESPPKPRIVQVYSEHTTESMTQSIDPMDIMPKSEAMSDTSSRSQRFNMRQPHRPPTQLQPQPHPIPHHMPPQQFFPNYSHSLLNATAANPNMSPGPSTPQQSHYTPGMVNRFRIFDAQQDNAFNIYPHCRCGAQKNRVDSPPPEPTNLCQTLTHTPQHTLAPASALSAEDHEVVQAMKLRLVHMQNNAQLDDEKAGSSSASDLPMHSYVPCSPKMICEEQDEELLPDSPHSQHHHQQHHLQQQEEAHERAQQQFMRQQQLQQQQQQHLEVILQEQQSTTNNSTAGTNNGRQRKERMSKRQKELYVTFLQQYQFINEHRRNDPVLDAYWLKLANLLNAVPQGAVKHVTEWKQTFDNWRYRVFLYARYNSKLKGDEALNPRNFKPLTRTDKHAYAIWIRNPDTAPPDLDSMRNVFVNLEETQQD